MVKILVALIGNTASSARLSLSLLLAASQPLWATDTQFQWPDGSIAAKPAYHGDHYFSPTGETIKLYRKSGVFALPFDAGSRSNRDRVKSDFLAQAKRASADVANVTKHNLPGAQVIRLKRSGLSSKQSTQGLSAVRSKMLSANIQPVFTTRTGAGDLLLIPKLTFSLSEQTDQAEKIDELVSRFNISIEKRLNVSGYVYSASMPMSAQSEPSNQFYLVRRIGAVDGVQWAEPQFFMQAQKASVFEPTDALYAQQWHLQNRGYRGSRCDADCDAINAWRLDAGAGAATGDGTVIAIIDDGVQLNHPDLSIELGGKDFVDDTATACGDDGSAGPDNDASPSPVTGCIVAGDTVSADDHGTAVAGVAAAKQGNGGVVGAAFNAKILPIRAISEYEVAALDPAGGSSVLCNRLAEAVEYAAVRADVINLSWNLPIGCAALTQAIERTTLGTVTVETGSRRANGSPVVVASGNNASGWVKVTTSVTVGEHAYEWRYLRSDTADPDVSRIDETVWLDDIRWSDGNVESFEAITDFSGGSEFTTDWVLNSCNAECTFNFGDEPEWGINTNSSVNYARSGSNAASLNVEGSDCGNSYLHALKEGPAGQISFWVWVSANTQDGEDKFEFLIDGKEVVSYGDLAAFGFVDNLVGYPANLSNAITSTEAGVIAVGASTSGDLSGASTALLSAEYRASYSQFGPTLDIVAPSSDQHLGITTTDRFSASGPDLLGFNTDASVGDIASDRAYTQSFGGTSASAALVSGVAAAMIAKDSMLSAQEVKTILKETADKVGSETYAAATPTTRNDQMGSGRLNMYNAIRAAAGDLPDVAATECSVQAFNYTVASDRILPRYKPQALAGFCPAKGAVPVPPNTCDFYIIRTKNGKGATICI